MTTDFTKPYSAKPDPSCAHEVNPRQQYSGKPAPKSKPFRKIIFIWGISSFLFAAVYVLNVVTEEIRDTLFYDDFSSNDHAWMVKHSEAVQVGFEDERYFIHPLRENGSWMVWNKEIPIDPNKDTRIEVLVQKNSDEIRHGYGIYYAGKNNAQFYVFAISENGYFTVYHYDEQNLVTDIPWTSSSHINQGSATNLLTVSLEGDQIHYLVNNHKVGSLGRHDFPGNLFGMIVHNNQKVYFDDFEIYQYENMSYLTFLFNKFKHNFE